MATFQPMACQPATHKTTVYFSGGSSTSFETVGRPTQSQIIERLWEKAVSNEIKPQFIMDYVTEELPK